MGKGQSAVWYAECIGDVDWVATQDVEGCSILSKQETRLATPGQQVTPIYSRYDQSSRA